MIIDTLKKIKIVPVLVAESVDGGTWLNNADAETIREAARIAAKYREA